jgi:hypothetical protein
MLNAAETCRIRADGKAPQIDQIKTVTRSVDFAREWPVECEFACDAEFK